MLAWEGDAPGNVVEEIDMAVPDLQIKTRVRSVLAKHWIDLTRIGFDCCRGSVRFRGEISLAQGRRCTSPSALLETLESEVRCIPGVKSVYLMGVTVAPTSCAPQQGESSEDSTGIELSVSDLEIKGRVRSVLAKHRVDPAQLEFDCCKGTLRFRGRICIAEGHPVRNSGVPFLETLESELKRIPGVGRVYFVGVKMAKDLRAPQEETTPEHDPA